MNLPTSPCGDATPAVPADALVVIEKLADALGYLFSMTWGEICEPADRPYYLDKAHALSAAALRAAAPFVWLKPAEHYVARIRREREEEKVAARLAYEARLPVKDHLRAERDQIRARVVAGLEVIGRWDGPSDGLRYQQAKVFLQLAERLVNLSAQVAAPLPTTAICACPRCARVSLPGWHGGYACRCGVWWGPGPKADHTPLPLRFWEKTRPGDPSGLRRDDQEKTA